MRKIGFIFSLIILLSGCSVLRSGRDRYTGDSENLTATNTLEAVESKNITLNNFYIEKAEFEVLTPDNKEKFLGSIRFEKPDKYLVSLKSLTGIEAARIYISKDTILANDRINRKLYSGSPGYVTRKYGIPDALFPVIFGDFAGNGLSERSPEGCIDGKLKLSCAIKGVRILYTIDCKMNKVISAVTENSENSENIRINYSGFYKKSELIYPGFIEINDIKRNTIIKIKILKITSPWEGEIEFIPGNRYELIRIL